MPFYYHHRAILFHLFDMAGWLWDKAKAFYENIIAEADTMNDEDRAW